MTSDCVLSSVHRLYVESKLDAFEMEKLSCRAWVDGDTHTLSNANQTGGSERNEYKDDSTEGSGVEEFEI